MTGVKITNPFRFFCFFGLFIVFLFLATRSCLDRKNQTELVDVENITDLKKKENDEKNSEELSEFIQDVKADIKKQDDRQKKLSIKNIEELEDENINKKNIRKVENRKSIKLKKTVIKKSRRESFTRKNRAWKSSTVMVVGTSVKLSYSSRVQLQKDVKILNKINHGKVMIYGNYFPGEKKSRGFARASKIKNELIRFGIKNSISVFILSELTFNRKIFGKVKFSK